MGIDIGTGSIKAITTDTAGNFLDLSRYSYPLDQPQKGYFEQNPEMIWNAFVLAVQHTVSQKGNAPEAISFSCAMHSLILVNDEGDAIYPMLTWADMRSEAIATQIRSSARGEEIYRITGTPIHPMSPLCKLIWFKQNQPDLFDLASRFISIKEYIWHRLFGVCEIDYSIASATGLFDIIALGWSSEVCEFAGIDSKRLSAPVDTTYTQTNVILPIADLLGIPTDTLFVIGASDGCCANLGSGAGQPGTGAITIGTSGAVRITSSAPVYNYPGMTFNYLLNKSTFVSGGAINNGGILVDWLLRNFLNDAHNYEHLFETIASIPAGSEGLIFLPYLYGERAPIWDAKSSGAYFNIQPKHTQAHFLRAALEGLCYTLQDVLLGLESVTANLSQINVSGGFSSSVVWVQLLTDVTGKKLMLFDVEEASAMGAVYLAMNVINPEGELPISRTGKLFLPDKDNQLVYQKVFRVFKKLYADVKDSMHALNQIEQPL